MKRWLRKFVHSSYGQSFFSFIGACYLRFVYASLSWRFVGKEILDSYLAQERPFIVCFWHGRMALMPFAWPFRRRKSRPFRMLLSHHRDGVFIQRILKRFGIGAIYGSTNKGGEKALRELLRALHNKEVVGITPDGPQGPYGTVSKGIVTVARLAKVDVLPLSYSCKRRRFLKSWDRFHVPLPFGKGVFVCEPPLQIPSDSSEEEVEAICQKLQEALHRATTKADEFTQN